MAGRENALYEALINNEKEVEKWEAYRREQETAISNLDEFSKHLEVEVMVPIGSKALMPGRLIHTNEVLVSHMQGYFSECSAYEATKICKHRIEKADEHLKKLKVEEELWQNKLNKPYLEGVLPGGDQQEIIEEYDEEKEKAWRAEHALRLKVWKSKEREEREAEMRKASKPAKEEKTDEEIRQMLEEAELMEELENELDNLALDEVTDETLRQLMSGEIAQTSKPRVAHTPKEDVLAETKVQGIVKKETPQTPQIATNNNVQPNPEIRPDTARHSEEDDEIPDEVKFIREQAQFLDLESRIEFFEYQVEIVRQKLARQKIKTEKDAEQRIHLHAIIDHLEDMIDMAAEELPLPSEGETDKEEEEEQEKGPESVAPLTQDTQKQKKKRLSFALEDETLEFRKNEIVADMLPKRDVITLDDPSLGPTPRNPKVEPKHVAPIDRKQSILDKVNKNIEHSAESLSKKDANLVDKILDSATGKSVTIDIGFSFSDSPGHEDTDQEVEVGVAPKSPAYIYRQYLKIKEHQEKPAPEDDYTVPVLKESNRVQAYEDPRAVYSNPAKSPLKDQTNSSQPKSILTNKEAVQREVHLPDGNENAAVGSNKKKKSKKPTPQVQYMSVYDEVVDKVVEKNPTQSDPLPAGNYIDSHAPKKRISLFKQQRLGK